MKKLSLLHLFLALLMLVLPVYPARGEIYSWRDQNGIENFSNSRDNIPPDAKVQVWTEKDPAPPPEKPNAEPLISSEEPAEPENNSSNHSDRSSNPAPLKAERVTQGRFAVQLVEELGLGKQPTTEEAAALLSRIRVSPPLGRWELERPVTPSLVTRLRTLTVSAAEVGTISIQPDEALLAFDTAAALLGVPITAATGDDISDPSYSTTVIQSPPLVLIAPPPPVYISSYVWVPVQPGFYWGGVWCSGYYVFDVGRRDYRFHRHRFDFPRDRIEHHFTDHVVRPRLHSRDGFPVRQPFQPGPPMINRRTEVRPPAPPPQMERRLRGGSPHSFSTLPRSGQTMPPSIGTPIMPRDGRPSPPTQITPLAPRTPMTPLAPTTPMTPLAPATTPKGGQLRGRSMNRQALSESIGPASPKIPSAAGGRPSLRRGASPG